MICKDDLVIWFKNLESYKRIDVMCTLLNLCLPFELRFLGTCLEELGRRDAQELRGVELRVNNPQDFVNEIGSFQTGQPVETKIRRKMALYLALMRASNRTGVNELFRTLDRWGDRDFSKFSDGDPLQELLLVYTMATNHPVFSFEQRLKCGEIYSKITSARGVGHLNQQQQQPTTTTSPLSSSSTYSSVPVQHSTASPPPSQQFQSGSFQPPPQSATAAPPPPPQQLQMNPAATQIPNPILMPMAFPPATLISGDPSTSALALSVDSLPSHHIVAAPPQRIDMVPIPTDFTTPPPITWHQSMRYQPTIYQTMVPIETPPQYPPQSSSPPSHHRDLSQPSSPTHSRTGSPTRQQQQSIPPPNQTHRRGMRNTRPSTETTPPPIQQQLSTNTQGPQQTQGSGTINYMGNDIMVQTTKNFDELNMDGAISQLHSIRNGYNRSSNTIPRHNNHKSNWQMHQWQPQQQQHYVLHQQHQNQHQKSTTGSESGSSTGDMSPPPQQQQQQQVTGIDAGMQMHGNANQSQSSGLRAQALNLSRLNGATVQQQPPSQHASNSSNSLEFNGSPASVGSVGGGGGGGGTLVTSNSSGNLLLVGAPMHNFPTYRNIPGTTTIQRQFPAQVNGEIALYPFNTGAPFINITTQQAQSQQQQTQRVSPSQTPPVLLPTPYPTNKLVQSCFNCGSINHTGLNCSEASMEDVTRNSGYKLDYTVSTQSNLPFTPALVMTSSSSMGNLNVANNNNPSGNSSSSNNNSNNNNNPETQLEPSIPFIDLTQDTSSDSSISNR